MENFAYRIKDDPMDKVLFSQFSGHCPLFINHYLLLVIPCIIRKLIRQEAAIFRKYIKIFCLLKQLKVALKAAEQFSLVRIKPCVTGIIMAWLMLSFFSRGQFFLCLVLVSLSYLLAISSYLRDRSESMIKEACETKSSRQTCKIQKQLFTGV